MDGTDGVTAHRRVHPVPAAVPHPRVVMVRHHPQPRLVVSPHHPAVDARATRAAPAGGCPSRPAGGPRSIAHGAHRGHGTRARGVRAPHAAAAVPAAVPSTDARSHWVAAAQDAAGGCAHHHRRGRAHHARGRVPDAHGNSSSFRRREIADAHSIADARSVADARAALLRVLSAVGRSAAADGCLLRVRLRGFALGPGRGDVLARAVLLHLEEVLLRVAANLDDRLGANIVSDFLPVAVVQVDRLEETVVLLVRPRFPRLGNRVRLARLAGLRLLHRARPLAPPLPGKMREGFLRSEAAGSSRAIPHASA
mmetsp:Transcript_3599/g.14445  ORF Transcript_3599/g.14445 Transcript_3599/m.14445 type:complete len:310 (+) Transcript_3599:1268-2197(+)